MGVEKKLKKSPDLKIIGLQIWIHGREYPDSNDYWDGDWLNVTVHCGSHNSNVWLDGPIIHLSELVKLQKEIKELNESLITNVTNAKFETIEPYLKIDFQKTEGTKIKITVLLIPKLSEEQHTYYFNSQEKDLIIIQRELEKICEIYKILGES